jgi:hypothetical protein
MEAYSALAKRHTVELYKSLSEKDRRRYAAIEAEKLGHGGMQYVADLFDCGADTIRLLGARIGRRVYLDTIDRTEFDLVRIADDAALNGDRTVQTHLFEDRIMKTSRVDIGPGCTVGARSLLLYDTRMQQGALLNDLLLLMKGESLPTWTCWQEIPAR